MINSSEWINVKNKLPKDYQTVLAYDGEGIVITCYFGNSAGFGITGITYWMPLPEPPDLS